MGRRLTYPVGPGMRQRADALEALEGRHMQERRCKRAAFKFSASVSTAPGAYPGGFAGYHGDTSQAAAGGRPLAVAAEVGREGGEGGAVREAARAV